MAVIEVRLLECIAAVLILQWVLNSTLKHTMLVVMAEPAKTGGDQALARGSFYPEPSGQALRVDYVQLVATCAPYLQQHGNCPKGNA